jgi:poly-gamma-glutamate capsule biosynthesis protein CapA/YwtB (metallophosphatase superfamily)
MTVELQITIALTGDSIIMRRLSISKNPDFLAVRKILSGADVGFTNLEGIFQGSDDYPSYIAGNARATEHLPSPPTLIHELQWFGINLVSMANNFSADFGDAGVLTNLRHLDAAGLAHAGTGKNLTQATAPAYLDTAVGRVALVAAYDWGPHGLGDLEFGMPMGVMAADGNGYYPQGRPGVNLLRFSCEVQVDKQAFESLRRTSEKLRWEQAKAARRAGGSWDQPLTGPLGYGGEVDTETEFHFMGRKFVLSDDFGIRTVPWELDLERNRKWIQEARRLADWVIVSLHNHGASAHEYQAPEHVRTFAHAAIDAGADVFVAHGVRDEGIELYQGKPVVYGTVGFIGQDHYVGRIAREVVERWGFDAEATSGEFALNQRRGPAGISKTFDLLSGNPRAVRPYDDSRIILVRFASHCLQEVRVIPLLQAQPTAPSDERGLPLVTPIAGAEGQRILEHIKDMSQKYGTDLRLEDGVLALAAVRTAATS